MRISFVGVLVLAWFLAGSASAESKYQYFQRQPEAEKTRFLRKSIRTAGNRCDRVSRYRFMTVDKAKTGYFAVACADGGDWMVAFHNDSGGSTRVMSCGMVKVVARVDCWK